MLIEHTIAPSVNLQTGDIILREVERNQFVNFFDLRDTLQQHSLAVVKTRDKAIREALIRLGWTPPPEPGQAQAARAAGESAGDACLKKAERVSDFDAAGASDFMLRHLESRGVTSSEEMVLAAKVAGFKPHDDRAFGPVFAGLVRKGLIRQSGTCPRIRGNGTAGGRLWRLAEK